ncbi:alpha/beta hydrolase [Parendozoicomonas haliclonae]|uniref:Phospholipase YtpA n=1 Tax=Parendozoicomonas haliclonae TaxID=1960125 RepID=A0A1X7AJ49_9GAMM|nr:alpha/beta hydrolase [Parendozoicomonas haliclonae]SMA45984.1 Phospholipase YtpA [Parendozoicomonas haliclonae]
MKPQRPVPDGQRLQQFKSGLEPLSVNSTLPDHLEYYLDAYGLNFQKDFAGLTYHCGYLTVDANQLFCQTWIQPDNTKGTMFILHGYYDHAGLYGHVIRFFLEQGYSVFAFDEPGHGLSDGAPANIESFSHYTTAVRQCLNWAVEHHLPQPFHLCGQSMGGAIITELLVAEECGREEFPLDKVILLAPLIRPLSWRWGWVQYQFIRHFVKQIPRSPSRSSSDQSFLSFLHKEPLQHQILPVGWVGAMSRWIKNIEKVQSACDFDVLIVQGQQDGTVDWQHNMPIYQRLYKSAKIHFIPEGQHNLANENEAIRKGFFDWLAVELKG